MAKILLVDDNPQNIDLLSLRLSAAGHETLEARNGEDALRLLREHHPNLMILDMQMPRLDGLGVLNQLKEDGIRIPVVVISAFATVERAVEAMKAGALDFITKPFDPTHLELVVERALERSTLEDRHRVLSEEVNARYHFVTGRSRAMHKVHEALLNAAQTTNPVLICGEGGTGKEVAARLIHRESERASAPFITTRCGAAPENLEAELFGTPDRKGKVEMAAGGTLFLDDVGKIGRAVQERLYQLLSTHSFTRTGGSIPIPSDVRIVSSTSQNLPMAVLQGTLREDLYQILAATRIELPPLRDRRDDIPDLVNHFVEKYNREVGRFLTGVSEEAMEALASYHWPGNVRELANIIERAVSAGGDEQIQASDLGIAATAVTGGAGGGARSPFTGDYRQQVRAARRQIVLSALVQTQGETDRAAQLLGLSRPVLDRLITSLGIRR